MCVFVPLRLCGIILNLRLFGQSRQLKRAILLIFLIFPLLALNAQYGTKAQLKNIDFELIDDKVIITYDLINAKPKELFDIKVEIFSSGGHKIEAQTFEGDFSDIKKGKKKQIKWYIGEDYVNFEDNIYVELTALHKNHMVINRVSRLEALGKSTLWPGWGSAQTTLKKSNYIKGVFAYGFLGTSAVFYNLSKDEMWRATQSNDEGRTDYYRKNAGFYEDLSYISLGVAGFFWLWEYGAVLFKPNISKKIKLDVDLGNVQNNAIPMLSFKANF